MPEDLVTTIGLVVIALLGVVGAGGALWRVRSARHDRRFAALVATLVGTIAAGLLVYRAAVGEQPWKPLASHVEGVLLLIGLLGAALAYLAWINRLRGVEVFGLPVVAVLGLWGVCASWWTFRPFDIRGVLDGVHIAAAYLGIAAAALAAAAGGEYLLVQHLLRKRGEPTRRIRVLGQMASLESIEAWMINAATAAFVLVSLVLVVGAVDAMAHATSLGTAWYAQPKVIGAAAGWLLLAGVCHVRFAPRFRGARAATLALLGFVVILVVLAMAVSLTGCGQWHGQVRIGSDQTAVEPVFEPVDPIEGAR